LSNLRVSFEHLFAGPSVLVFDNQNMVKLIKRIIISSSLEIICYALKNEGLALDFVTL